MKFILFFITAFFACNFLKAKSNQETWKTIKTEHFDVIVSARHYDLGLYYAHAAEKSYQNLSTVFTNLTKKIVLVVNDTTDVPNGYATRIPYPHIVVYAVPVNDHDSLSESGNWARELITHELTHILQLEPASGFYSVLRPIFGNIVAPNLLTPLWWKEGMAVEMETQFSPRGRLRSIYQDTTIRSFVLDNKLQEYTLPQANESLPSWPYGGRPYLFGSLFFSHLNFTTRDIKSSGFLANRQGERLPYFIEQPLYELTQNSYQMQYAMALLAAETNSLTQIQQLKKIPVSELTNFEHNPNSSDSEATVESSYQPRYSDKFKLLAYIESKEGRNALVVLDENHNKLNRKNLPSGILLSIDFHPSEKKILYTKVDKIDRKHTFSDLHIYDIDLDQSTPITFAQRGRAASFSANGEQVVFISTFAGQTQINIIDLTVDPKTKPIQFIIGSGHTNRYESPIFWDEETILTSKIDTNGNYGLVKINLRERVESNLSLGLNFVQIRFLRKKNNSLYFVSAKNGVNNLYFSKDLMTAKPVSHVLSGIWSYDINSDETQIWASLLTGTGFKISKIKPSHFDQELPVIENQIQKHYTYSEETSAYNTYPSVDYTASSYLLPTYWIPFFAANNSSKGIFLQAQTSGHDPIKHHQYTVTASYDSELEKGNFSGLYANDTQKIPFQISSLVQNRALGSSTQVVQTTTHAISLLPDVFSINKNMLFQIGLQLQDTYFFTKSQHAGPFTQVTYKNYEQNIFQISPTAGWGGLLKFEKNYKLYAETDLIAKDYERASLSWIGFASPHLPKHHALKAKISGLITFSTVLGRYGSSSSSSFVLDDGDGLTPQFVMRGYAPAQFFGRSLWNANLEYRFPLNQIERGSGTDPYFLKRLSGAVIADAIAVEGSGLLQNQQSLTLQNLKLNESIWNTGFELKLESTMGYLLPVSFVLGYYFPHSPAFASSSQLGLSLQIGGF